MSNAPQAQKPQAQKNEYSNQGNTAQKVGNNVKKDEPTAQSGKDNMTNEGGKSSTADTKPKSSNI